MAINTAEDVIRVIRDNPGLIVRVLSESPEALAEARRIILTDEVIALPEQFNRMLNTQNRMLDAQAEMLREIRQLTNTVGGLNETVGGLTNTVGGLNETVGGLINTVGGLTNTVGGLVETVGGLSNAVGELRNTVSGLEDRVGHLIGSELERKLAVVVPHRLRGRFNMEISQILVYQDRDPVVSPDFLIRIDEARNTGLISMEQHRRIRDTDMIVQAQSQQDGEVIYFAVEAGAALERRDIDRAITSSELVGSVLNVEVTPLVVAYTIADDVRRYNQEEKGGRVNILQARRRN